MKRNNQVKVLAAAAASVLVAGCAAVGMGGEDPATARAVALMNADFKTRGQATADRIKQDEVQKICSEYVNGKKLPRDMAQRLEKSQQALIKYPADGKYLGDWKAGERVAQVGQGMQWSDDPKKPGGGNCYACHQISKAELSYGTIGPSLYNFGKLRGFTPEMQRYAYAKVYNSQAFSACSSMPRFGHQQILSEKQIKDVVALLMDPNSPVNK